MGSLEDEIGGGSQKVIVPCGIGDLAENARWDVDVIRGEECFERVPARGSLRSPVNNRCGEIQQHVRIDDGNDALRHRQARDSPLESADSESVHLETSLS